MCPEAPQGCAVCHPPGQKSDQLTGVKVLVCDPWSGDRRFADVLRSKSELTVDRAPSSAAALLKLRAAAAEPYQIVILEHHMPEVDARETAGTIKADPDLAETVLVALAAGGRRGDAQRMKEAGFAAYVVKPARLTLLLEILAAALKARGQGGEPELITSHSLAVARTRATAPGGDTCPRHQVLLVDDNAINRRIAHLMLEKLGVHVDHAEGGRQAVDMADRAAYDLIFMDCQMPDMDGYQATARIRRQSVASKAAPIVAITAHAFSGSRPLSAADVMGATVTEWRPGNGDGGRTGWFCRWAQERDTCNSSEGAD